ncbi:MAG: type II toxin-antitoxin system RelB/DinJ family antitoxin [Proteobacteria bacterium]|uniref:Type II toxin-antitoxin system RelB/DinJ family antitoxin n=1 Tax=Candidatus Avisuccinivibrio stercorigallinarum TaxID=2840704 RepID=A0A9D9DEJ6_9GAMM|nr:type II toxin-antitoxin system RelB/DinJ family antitoxin [Candidatus Avisuccinivibrio stercorigallinarum]
MAEKTTTSSISVDADLKARAEALFAELGLDRQTAVNIFLRQSLREDGFPFEIKLADHPNEETIAAMLEAARIAKDPSVKGYKDVDELFADLDK